jgi:hypothetical protein
MPGYYGFFKIAAGAMRRLSRCASESEGESARRFVLYSIPAPTAGGGMDMKKRICLAALCLVGLSACALSESVCPSGTAESAPEYGYMLRRFTAKEVEGFLGTWRGNISGFDFELIVKTEKGAASATLEIDAGPEHLFLLGANETTLYFFRERDNACLSMYPVEGGGMVLEYYEQGAPRVVALTRIK